MPCDDSSCGEVTNNGLSAFAQTQAPSYRKCFSATPATASAFPLPRGSASCVRVPGNQAAYQTCLLPIPAPSYRKCFFATARLPCAGARVSRVPPLAVTKRSQLKYIPRVPYADANPHWPKALRFLCAF